jgi:hypothetical protein
MARFYGNVGYVDTVENPPDSGVWVDEVTEVSYYGDVVRNTRRLLEGQKVNDDLSVNNSISIVADAYAGEHFHAIRYVIWLGGYWIVDTVDVEPPRLILRLGGVYNGPKAPTPGSP